jgi:hypothetical protein
MFAVFLCLHFILFTVSAVPRADYAPCGMKRAELLLNPLSMERELPQITVVSNISGNCSLRQFPLKKGMEQKSIEFRKSDAEIYKKA